MSDEIAYHPRMLDREIHEGGEVEIHDLCRRVLGTMDQLVNRAVDRIREELPDYESVPEPEHWADVHEQLTRRVRALDEDLVPGERDLASAADLARSRARQRVPISTLIDAFHIGDSEVWRALVAASTARDAPYLPHLASRMMDSIHALSAALASAHSEVTQTMQGHHITLAHRLVELLALGGHERELHAVAQALGLSPTSSWQAFLWAPPRPADDLSFGLQQRIGRLGAHVICAAREQQLVIVADRASAEAVRRFVGEELQGGRIGIGVLRPGLAGASESLEDARLVLNATAPGRTTREFAEGWVEACVLAHSRRLGPLLDGAIQVAREQPHLADAVEASYLSSMSLTGAAARLHLHANSVTYRLARWRELTGLDPRSVPTLVQSWLAVHEARRFGTNG